MASEDRLEDVTLEEVDVHIKDVQEPLLLETVWLQQTRFEEAEAAFLKLTLNENDEAHEESPLLQESVWLKQLQFEEAETWYYMNLAGTADPNTIKATPGTPSKRLHVQDSRTNVKRQKHDVKGTADSWSKKLQGEVTGLSKTAKAIQGKLDEFEKAQQRKAQAIKDTTSRLTSAIAACQTRLNDELLQSGTQLSSFRSVVAEVESVVGKTNDKVQEQRWGRFKTHEDFCQAMADRLSKLNQNLNSCAEFCNSFQMDIPKSDINRIVGEIGKVSFIKKLQGSDKFNAKKDAVAKLIKDLLKDDKAAAVKTVDRASPAVSDGSLEGSGSVTSEDSESESEGKVVHHVRATNKPKPHKGKENKTKKALQNKKHGVAAANRNNSNMAKAVLKVGPQGGAKPAAAGGRPDSGQNSSAAPKNSATPKKRNAQGAQSIAQKQQELFKFKGGARAAGASNVPFLNQPGLLGPRPNVFPMQAGSPQAPFRFSDFNQAGQKQRPSIVNFGAVQNANPVSAANRTGFGNMNFNFSSPQSQTSPLDFRNGGLVQNPSLASIGLKTSPTTGSNSAMGNISSQVRQSKLFQIQQNQAKSNKQPQLPLGAQAIQTGFSFSLPQKSGNASFLQNAQGGMMAGRLAGGGQSSMEHQLNELSQKIQQMQLQASQNFQLQQLMQETERLKQLLAQKQHEHQQQDRFQHQFQLLINAFLQQQQQQQAQGPQSKMAKQMTFHNSQRQQQQQRLMHNKQQQQKKQKQQQNKVQQVKLEQQQQNQSSPRPQPKNGGPQNKIKQEVTSDQQLATGGKAGPHNGQSDGLLGVGKRKVLSRNSKVAHIGMFKPHTQGDMHQAGVSSVVVLESVGCVVIVDIINSCLKLYDIAPTQTGATSGPHHQFVTRLGISRPYYLSRLNRDTVIVSRESRLLSLVKVSKRRLEFLQDIGSESQYYGLSYVRDNIISCAAFADSRLDLVSIQDGVARIAPLVRQCPGAELVSTLSSTGSILYLERVPDVTVCLISVSQQGKREFTVNLESSPTDVWNIASTGDRIVCCNKQTSKVKLFSKSGAFLTELAFPPGSVNKPFAMAFCDSGDLYIANDSAWDKEHDHYVTTEINLYSFS